SAFSTRITRAPSHASRYVRYGSVVACSRLRTVTPARRPLTVAAGGRPRAPPCPADARSRRAPAAGPPGSARAGRRARDGSARRSPDRSRAPFRRRADRLALGAVRHDGAGHGIDDLDVVVILPDVDPAARGAVDAEPRPAGLRHADDVVGADAELPLDSRAELVGPHLGAEDADAQRERREVEAFLARRLQQPQRIRGDRRDDRRLEIAHELELQRRP